MIEKYKVWNVMTLKNKWMKIFIAPQLGGRIIQLEMSGYEYFFANPLLKENEKESVNSGKNTSWQNFGGEKIWPAPQGWNSPDMWPGPPDPVLDGGEYKVIRRPVGGRQRIGIRSLYDAYTGLQISRDIEVLEKFSCLNIQVTFHNKGETKRKWAVWTVCQLDSSNEETENQYIITCPVNPISKFSDGYTVMHGLVNNPQYRINIYNNFVVDYKYLVGKVGLDSNAGWAAFINKKLGKAFILLFNYKENEVYPDNTSFQIWIQGRGLIFSRNNVREFPNDKNINPPYMEMELLSPLHEIEAGKKVQFNYQMLVCAIPKNEDIKHVSNIGIIVTPLMIKIESHEIKICGKYGVFIQGTIRLQYNVCHTDRRIKQYLLYEKEVNPIEGIEISVNIRRDFFISEGKGYISLELIDSNRRILGELERVNI
jgi:hypothetical protein